MTKPVNDKASLPPSQEALPYVSSSVVLPELTVKAIILGVVLSVVLAAANAYLGLLAGMTVSASVPAAVMSMAVLRLFRRRNILENNLVQTAASAGESLAAGVIFTFPALIILGVWKDFDYVATTGIAALGGLIGVLFTIPLRRALIVENPLTFPEGVATSEVLLAGESHGKGVVGLVWGGVLGGIFKLLETGLGVLKGAWEVGGFVGKGLWYFGVNWYPALAAVGYIVGLPIAVLVLFGGLLNWGVAIPWYSAIHPAPEGVGATEYAWTIWSTQTRYLGVGAMVVGGFWALIRLSGSLVSGIRSSFHAYAKIRDGGMEGVERTDRDLPIVWVLMALAACSIPLFWFVHTVLDSVGVALLMTVVMLVAGFLFSAVASYMAGLVGSSNNPISGVTIATLLMVSLLLLALMGAESNAGPAAAILIGAVVCCAAAIGGDNMQDLKAGRILGATPWKQQVAQILGVLAAAVVVAPVLTLLLKAYGIGGEGVGGREPLAAPQASLMAAVAKGVFAKNLPWGWVGLGMGIAGLNILVDVWLERRKASFRAPVLAVAVGIYLPLELAVGVFVGGLVAFLASGGRVKNAEKPHSPGLLFAAGVIAGEAVVGILLAIPILLNEGKNPLDVSASVTGLPSSLLGGLVFLAVVALLWKFGRGQKEVG